MALYKFCIIIIIIISWFCALAINDESAYTLSVMDLEFLERVTLGTRREPMKMAYGIILRIC